MRLFEGELAESLKVSRGPVREALRRLVQEGLVRIVPGGGTFVSTITEDDIIEIYGLRAALEGYAARAATIQRVELADLEKALERMRISLNAMDLSTIIEADVVFHRSLIALAKNRRLLAGWGGLEGQVRLILSLTRDQVYRDPQGLAEQHVRLVDALRSGEGDQAERRFREHIEGRIGERLAYWREVVARQPGPVAGR
jgi:DNA-binding GntR family transcriptional regulator